MKPLLNISEVIIPMALVRKQRYTQRLSIAISKEDMLKLEEYAINNNLNSISEAVREIIAMAI